MAEKPLAGQAALVTGGGGGIGSASAAWLARDGAAVLIMGRTESTLTITVYVTVLLIPMTLAPAVLVWETPGLDMWVWLIFIGVIGTLGQLVVTEAVKLADMTVLMPFDFLKLV